jgi:uncharacterized protein YifN (PemK superfamily)
VEGKQKRYLRAPYIFDKMNRIIRSRILPIHEHPEKGAILMCDFTGGFKNPEMVKKRPIIVLSPKIKARHHLCTVVSLSTTPPDKEMPYHAQIDINPPLPHYFESNGLWVKGDMVNAVGFHRLDFIRTGKDLGGKRTYYYQTISEEQIKLVQSCILRAMGLSPLTKHL